MKTATLKIEDEVWCTVLGLSQEHYDILWHKLGIYVEGYFFMPAYKMGRFDGKRRFFQKTGKTYTRLLDKIVPYLVEWNYEIDIIDKREQKVWPKEVGKILKLDSQGICIEAEGLDLIPGAMVAENIPFKLRPYQLQCINAAITAGSGFIIAGTGAGKCLSGNTLLNLKYEDSEEINVCSYDDLFSTIEYTECHKFKYEEAYCQFTKLQVEGKNGWTDVKCLIKKQAKKVILTLEDGSTIECADKHIVFDKFGELYADEVVVGDALVSKEGFRKVVDVKIHEGLFDFYDIEVADVDHAYYTANGMLHHNTSITAGLSYVYSQLGYRVLTMVPSTDLVLQTAEWYEKLGIDTGVYSGTEKNLDALNIVATWQAVQYNPDIMEKFDVFIWDEAHGVGAEVAQKLINEHGQHIAFRFGVTGTFPKPEVDKLNLLSSIGPILIEIKARWLIDNGYLAEIEIQPIEINESYIDEEFPSYDAERSFIIKSPARMEKIADIVISQAAKYGNTLVLVSSVAFGKKLSALIKDSVFIYGDTDTDVRREHYSMYENRNDIIFIATLGVASTGISIDRIFHLAFVDIGKSFIKAIQSAGRGLRLGKDKKKVYVSDIHSKLKWAKKHFKDRAKYYTEAEYPVNKKVTVKVSKSD